MGTPGFAVPSLKAIAKSRHEIMLVVTGEDKQAGRGRSLRESPVKTLARELNLPILQPPTLKSTEFTEQLTQYNADIIVVVAFRILPGEVIDITPNGAINLHASLLPKYRGAAPINRALINGDTQTGVTIFQIRPRVDTGDILAQGKVDISEQDTFGILYDKLSRLGAKILVQTLDKLEAGESQPIPQSHELATKAPKIYPELGEIDWTKDARAIKWLIHGLSPAPGAYTFYKKKRIKILTAEYSTDSISDIPGEIVTRDKKQFGIQTGKGVLYPLELQVEGRKTLAVADFLKGFKAKVGEYFSS